MKSVRTAAKKIAVLGTGAIGSCIGGFLTKAGYDVLLIDQWPAHVEAMKAKGLSITMVDERFNIPVRAVHLWEVCTLNQQFDIVFLAPKSYDSCWMVEFIKPYLKRDGVIVSTQNSLNPEWIVPIIGYSRTMGSVTCLAAYLFAPGEVMRYTPPSIRSFTVGELHGRVTPRLKEVVEVLNSVSQADITTNIWGGLWTKVLVASSMSVTALAGDKTVGEWTKHHQILKLLVNVSKEALHVGSTLGYTLENIFGKEIDFLEGSEDEMLERAHLGIFKRVTPEAVNVPAKDFEKGLHTETDFMNGLIVKKGREAGVPTPLNEAVCLLVGEIEQGKRKPDPTNLEVLKQCL